MAASHLLGRDRRAQKETARIREWVRYDADPRRRQVPPAWGEPLVWSMYGAGGLAVALLLRAYFWTQGTIVEWLLWILYAAIVIVIFISAATARKRAIWKVRINAELCARCGFDLRASRDRCPECGAAVERHN